MYRRIWAGCQLLPSALTVSFTVNAGGITANGFSADFVFNLYTGESSIFVQTQVGAGINNGANVGANVGYVWGLQNGNSAFTNLSSSINGSVGAYTVGLQSTQQNWINPLQTIASVSAVTFGVQASIPGLNVPFGLTVGTSSPINSMTFNLPNDFASFIPGLATFYQGLQSLISPCIAARNALGIK
jgi:hypothetical protein